MLVAVGEEDVATNSVETCILEFFHDAIRHGAEQVAFEQSGERVSFIRFVNRSRLPQLAPPYVDWVLASAYLKRLAPGSRDGLLMGKFRHLECLGNTSPWLVTFRKNTATTTLLDELRVIADAVPSS